MLHDHRQMLVPAEMHRPGAADERQRPAAWRLRPAVAVQISQQAALRSAVHMHRAAKCSLRKDSLHLGIRPVLRPALEKFFLAGAEELQPG